MTREGLVMAVQKCSSQLTFVCLAIVTLWPLQQHYVNGKDARRFFSLKDKKVAKYNEFYDSLNIWTLLFVSLKACQLPV